MLNIPISRWGEPYKSLDLDKVVHFDTGEVLAEVSRANGGLVERDMRFAKRARDVPRESAIKASRRSAAVCCRAIRPAFTRFGCRSVRCRSAWCSSPARRSRGRLTA